MAPVQPLCRQGIAQRVASAQTSASGGEHSSYSSSNASPFLLFGYLSSSDLRNPCVIPLLAVSASRKPGSHRSRHLGIAPASAPEFPALGGSLHGNRTLDALPACPCAARTPGRIPFDRWASALPQAPTERNRPA